MLTKVLVANCGEVIPWSRAQMTDTPSPSITRFRRMALPTSVIAVVSFPVPSGPR